MIILMLMNIMLTCLALDLCNVIIYAMLFVFMLCFCAIDTYYVHVSHCLHHVQCFLINLLSIFYAQTVFVFERATYFLEK